MSATSYAPVNTQSLTPSHGNAMSIHKIFQHGAVTLTIASTRLDTTGQFGPQYCFYSNDEDPVLLFVGQQTAERQLQRFGMTPDQAVGATLSFTPVTKDGKRFVDINVVDEDGMDVSPMMAQALAAKRPAAPAQKPFATGIAAAQKKVDVGALGALYNECLLQAVATLGALCETNGIACDGQALQSAAATLFIAATKHGV